MQIIYLSGIDGCGKTTQAKLLVEALRQKGLNTEYMWFRWEPTVRKIVKIFRYARAIPVAKDGENIAEFENAEQRKWLKFKRYILTNSFIKTSWLYYASADYFMAYKRRFKKVAADVIVMDRYIDDFVIDQAVNLNLPPECSSNIKNNYFLAKFHFPNHNIIIDLPAAEGYARKSDGTSLSYLETRETYYRAMLGRHTLHLNGLESIDALSARIKAWVYQQLDVTDS